MRPSRTIVHGEYSTRAWAAAAVPFVEDWKRKVAALGIDGDRIHAEFLAIRAKWERELSTRSYPWKR